MTVEVINDVTNVTVTQTGPLNVEVSTTGLQGASGPSNVLTIDTVTPLAPSATPTVILGGTSPAQTISFGIPVGARILQGTTVPAGALGQVGFWYINTSTWDVYEKTAAAVWTSRGNIKGATGNTGPAPNLTIGTVSQNTPGSAGTASVTGTNPNYVLNIGIPIANWTVGTTSSLTPGSTPTIAIGGTALNPTLNVGVPRGSAFLNGTSAPATGTGNQGDWYLNTITWDIYEKTAAAVWTLRGNIKGAQGNIGNTGPANSLSIGTVTTGAVGSSASATITGTAPTQTLNLTLPIGATGPTGPAPNMDIGTVTTLAAGASATATITGTNPNYSLNLGLPQGLKGDIGAQWYAGSGAPGAGTGVVGDFYLVASGTGVGDVYKKTGASAWTLQGNIRGQAGSGDVESVNGVLPVGGNVTLAWTDIAGLIPASKLPSLATVETYTVATQAAMLALSAQRGDLAIRTDLDETYILSGDDPAVLANWTQLLTDGGNVRLTGNQTISGVKTFSSAPVVPDASWTISKTSGLQAALDSKAPLANPTFTGTVSGITKAMVGLGNVANAAQVELTGAQTIAGVKTFSSAPVVPDASFTIAKTSGLQSALDGKAATSHNHAATQITSGTLDIARIPTGTTGTTVALGNHLHTGVYEPLIAAGTTAQYRRGDNTWQTLNVAAVSGLQAALDLKASLAGPAFTGSATLDGQALVKTNDSRLANTNNIPRLTKQANAGASYEYVEIARLPVDNSGNYSSVIISGRAGGWVNTNMAYWEIMLTNRSDYTGNNIGASVMASGAWQAAQGITDIVVYKQADLSAIVYAKVTSYYAYDLSYQTFQATPTYTGTAVTPTGTQIWALSAAPKLSVDQAGVIGGSGASLTGITISQVSGAAPLASPTFTGTLTAPNVTVSGLTASRVLTTGTGGALAVSPVTTTELGYLSGVTSAIQTQLNGKEGTLAAGTTAQYYRGDKTWQTLNVAAVSGAAPLESPTFTGTVSGITKAMVGLGSVNNAAQVELAGNQTIAGTKTFSSAPVVPDNSFTIAKTNGLQSALDGKSATSHGHALTDSNITGVLPYAQLPVGTAANTVAAGNDSRITGAEQVSNKSTNTALGTSNTLYPTQNAVKTYVDTFGTFLQGVYARRDYGGLESHTNAPATSGTVTLNVSLASIFSITPTGNVTFAFSGLSGTDGQTITIIINSNATARTITWPSAVDWGTGSAPTMTANKTTIVTLLTVDGGTKIHARAA